MTKVLYKLLKLNQYFSMIKSFETTFRKNKIGMLSYLLKIFFRIATVFVLKSPPSVIFHVLIQAVGVFLFRVNVNTVAIRPLN